MSKSLMDAIRQTITEGAREKTSDGMTKDAKHFAQELHKVSDAGFKHMVQKDSETSDYAKMFNGNVSKAPTRPADYEPGQDLDKYVEYNEAKEMKNDEKHDGDCECDDCSSDDNKVNEAAGVGLGLAKMSYAPKSKANIEPKSLPGKPLDVQRMRGGAGMQAYATSRDKDFKPKAPPPPQWGRQAAERLRDKPAVQTPPAPVPVNQAPPKPKAAPVSPAAREPKAAAVSPGAREPATPVLKPAPVSPAAREPVTPKKVTPTGNPKMAGSAATPPKPQAAKPVKQKPQAAKPVAPKPQAAKPVAPARKETNFKRQQRLSKSGRDSAKFGPQTSSFEIDINGTSYLVSEAHASAIAAFVEKHGMVNEVLTKSTTAGETIKDFVHSDNPKFKGKSKKKRMQMALAAYYSKQREK